MDGEYELVPSDSRIDQEVNLNCANLSQDLGQAPEVFLPDSAQEGKPPVHYAIICRVIIHLCIYNVLY